MARRRQQRDAQGHLEPFDWIRDSEMLLGWPGLAKAVAPRAKT